MTRQLLAALVAATAVGGCGFTAESSGTVTTSGPQSTVAIGGLPQPLSDAATPPPDLPEPSTTSTSSTSTTTTVPVADRVLTDMVDGNRLLMIGDSVLASASPRYGGAMCEALTSFDWDVEIDAQTNRPIQFALEVLEERLVPAEDLDWDAVAVFLGNNPNGDDDEFRAVLREVLDLVDGRPLLLSTVSEVNPRTTAANVAIRELAEEHANVLIFDWAAITEDDVRLVGGDGVHLSPAGREAMALYVAAAIGDAPGFLDGECLPPAFVDGP